MMSRADILARASRKFSDAELDLLADIVNKLDRAHRSAVTLSKHRPLLTYTILYSPVKREYAVECGSCFSPAALQQFGDAIIVTHYVNGVEVPIR